MSEGRTVVAATSTPPPSLTPQEEVENVHRVYDVIAPHFSNTRYKAWPRVKEFVERVTKDNSAALVADIGCGNGKNMLAPYPHMIGSDYCENLVKLAQNQHHSNGAVLVADALKLPFRDRTFTAGICIAVLHHISTVERRITLLREAARVLRPGALFLCYAWAQEQEKKKYTTQDVMIPWTNRAPVSKRLREDLNNSGNKDDAGENSSSDKNNVLMRYCHLYQKGELDALISEHCSDCLKLKESFFDKENWCIVCERI